MPLLWFDWCIDKWMLINNQGNLCMFFHFSWGMERHLFRGLLLQLNVLRVVKPIV